MICLPKQKSMSLLSPYQSLLKNKWTGIPPFPSTMHKWAYQSKTLTELTGVRTNYFSEFSEVLKFWEVCVSFCLLRQMKIIIWIILLDQAVMYIIRLFGWFKKKKKNLCPIISYVSDILTTKQEQRVGFLALFFPVKLMS